MAGKSDIAEHLANETGMSKKQAGEACDAIFDGMASMLGNGDKVSIPGFGTFTVSHRAARQGINPQTKKPMKIAASNSVRFKPSKNLKDQVN